MLYIPLNLHYFPLNHSFNQLTSPCLTHVSHVFAGHLAAVSIGWSRPMSRARVQSVRAALAVRRADRNLAVR